MAQPTSAAAALPAHPRTFAVCRSRCYSASITVSTSFCISGFAKVLMFIHRRRRVPWRRRFVTSRGGLIASKESSGGRRDSAGRGRCSPACGGSEEPPQPVPGKTLHGETETGMKLTVDTFLEPSKDPQLKKIDDWRAASRLPGGRLPPRDRGQLRRARSPTAAGRCASRRAPERIPTGEVVEARFSCDVLAFEWVPPAEDKTQEWNDLRSESAPTARRSRRASPRARSKVYYLVTDRGFAERGTPDHAGVRPARRRAQVEAEPRRSSDRRGSAGSRSRGRQREPDRLGVAAGGQRLGRADRLAERDRHRVVG